MHILRSLDELTALPHRPTVVTLGMFDGVHRGHQALFHQITQKKQEQLQSVCLTFVNHPLSVLAPDRLQGLLCTLEHRQRLIAQQGIDYLLLLPFTKSFSEQTAEAFLSSLYHHLPFDHLVLGHDAYLGHQRTGTPETIQAIGKKYHFQVEYITPLTDSKGPISSSRIRQAIEGGNLSDAHSLLGRPLSYLAPIQAGRGLGKKIGIPTANLDVHTLTLPPFGVYAATVKLENHHQKTKKGYLKGVANLGVAPTLQRNRLPLLEVHLFDYHDTMVGATAEILLHHFLRPEKQFESPEALKKQIGKDIDQAKEWLDQQKLEALAS